MQGMTEEGQYVKYEVPESGKIVEKKGAEHERY